ncbi:MAG: hypothetical protein ACE5D2_07090 [Fidelibacterota bacterium]
MTGSQFRFCWFILLIGGILLQGQSYTVSVYGFPIARANLDLTARDTIRMSYEVTGWLNYFFPARNSYITVYDSTALTCRSFEKNIHQGSFKQKVKITCSDSTINYEGQSRSQSGPHQTIFTLLVALTRQGPEELDTRWFDLNNEGQTYRARLLWADSTTIPVNSDSLLSQHYRVDLFPTGQDSPFYDVTDTFMKYVGQAEAVKQIWVEESGKHRIIKAVMKVHGLPFQVLMNHE